MKAGGSTLPLAWLQREFLYSCLLLPALGKLVDRCFRRSNRKFQDRKRIQPVRAKRMAIKKGVYLGHYRLPNRFTSRAHWASSASSGLARLALRDILIAVSLSPIPR